MEPTLIFGTLGAVFTLGTPVVWAVRTAAQAEGKIATLKAIVDERDDKLTQRLDRMESKIDKVLEQRSDQI